MTRTTPSNTQATKPESEREYRFASKNDVICAAIQYIEESARTEQACITRPSTAANLLRLRIGAQEREVFSVAYLNTQHQLIDIDDLFFGTLDGAAVYPREVVKAALLNNAAAVILSHNHPSGSLTPSAADRRITERLREALALVEIRVLDHVIVTRTDAYSFAEHGLL